MESCDVCRHTPSQYLQYFSSIQEIAHIICVPCSKKLYQCSYCNIFIVGKIFQRRSKLLACNYCESQAIKSTKALKNLFSEAEIWLQKSFDIEFLEEYSVLAVYPQDINPRFNPRQRQRSLGLCEVTYIIKNKVKNISKVLIKVEIDMPLFKTKNVIIHELTHFWQQLNFPQFHNMKIEFVEGHAEYIAWLHDKSQGLNAVVKRRIEDKSYPYGTGFQKFKQLQIPHTKIFNKNYMIKIHKKYF